jgi:hypothetical protein
MASSIVAGPDHTAEPARCRTFGLIDAMIVIAGVAICLAAGAHLFLFWADRLGRLCRAAAAHGPDMLLHWPVFWNAIRDDLRNTLWYGFQFTMSALVGLTLAFFAVRLRRPRPPLRVLIRQPGTVGGLAMVFGLFWVTGYLYYLFPDSADASTAAPIAMAGSVAAAWSVLVLSRRWQSEPGWIDRMGRLLGVIAIANGLLGLVVHRI